MSSETVGLDQDWVDLILEAMELGLNVQDIKLFLEGQQQVG
ncbi:anti-repressor SinI family protein [Bacillus luteolus]|uniref:Anti-repressor SinI family protein n=1 Tax=Litchfieldia luteola TaxID=682179 RepID=A0ABR9QHG2_9BACI|nr:anti-repressor SinI family protein [Cytobacillus luteolus]MBE4907932.1 anti-repressor SinI family protein [Cytobacillus luteolus]